MLITTRRCRPGSLTLAEGEDPVIVPPDDHPCGDQYLASSIDDGSDLGVVYPRLINPDVAPYLTSENWTGTDFLGVDDNPVSGRAYILYTSEAEAEAWFHVPGSDPVIDGYSLILPPGEQSENFLESYVSDTAIALTVAPGVEVHEWWIEYDLYGSGSDADAPQETRRAFT